MDRQTFGPPTNISSMLGEVDETRLKDIYTLFASKLFSIQVRL